jgi:hypothetical protein
VRFEWISATNLKDLVTDILGDLRVDLRGLYAQIIFNAESAEPSAEDRKCSIDFRHTFIDQLAEIEMLDRNHNSTGNHGHDLVSYIYDELDSSARNAFETHLAICDECAIELAAISDARVGVVEWRREDFEHLATPVVMLSEVQPAAGPVNSVESIGVFSGLLETIRSLSPVGRAGAAVAALLLIAGLVYLGTGLRTTNEQVASDNHSQSRTPATIEQPKSVGDPEFAAREEDDFSSKDKPEERRIARPQNAPKRQMAATNTTRKRVEDPAYRKLGLETAVRTQPRLNSFDEEDDNSLRLTDLFAEVGGRRNK